MSDDDLRVAHGRPEPTEERRVRRKRPSSEGVPLDDSLDGSAKRRTRSQDFDDSLDASAGKRKVSNHLMYRLKWNSFFNGLNSSGKNPSWMILMILRLLEVLTIVVYVIRLKTCLHNWPNIYIL